ncbi:MAG: hypothetical protein KDC44_01545, partial [Phaeodactylibacter sp.]|nr:hypothetical protein [Phaeodactylibacter sp.]
VFDLFVDRQGIVWVGTTFGVYQLKVYPNYFERYLYRQVDPQTIEDTHSCRGILENAATDLWVNTSQGSYRVDLSTGAATLLDRDTAGDALNFPFIRTRDRRIWTARQDLKQLDTISGRLLNRYAADQGLSAWALFEARDGTIWIGDALGLYYFHPERHETIQTFRQYNEFEELAQAMVLHFHQDRQGRIWIASSKGLYELDTEEGIIARYWKRGKGRYYLPSSRYYFTYEDEAGDFWLATNGEGLIRFNPRQPEARMAQFTGANGLASNVLYAIFEDDDRHLWMSSNWGIIRFDKQSFEVQTYLPEHGLSHFEFNRISALQTPEGQIYFGGLNGITSFHPSDFYKPEPYDPPLVITAFRQLDIAEDTLQDRLHRLKEEGRIVIRPNYPFFMLSFGLQDYWNNEEHQFQYLIDGYINHWTTIKGNTLNLSSLPYGDWVLRVRGRGADGRLSSRELSIAIDVVRPFYLNPVAWAVKLLLLTFIGIYYFRWRTRQFRKREEQLEQKVASRTATIREQAEKLKELDELKSRFFANASHALRTPLTLILGPAEALLRNDQLDNDAYKKLAQIYGNAKKMLQQTNDILDLAKLESGSLQLAPKATDLYPYLKQLVDTFEQQALLKGVHLGIEYRQATSIQVWIDREKVGQIISNLLSNALKFTDNGQVVLTIDYDEEFLN